MGRAAATPPPTELGKFDGREVIGTTIAITAAGDGLSAALSIEPQVFHHGQRVNVVLECEVTKVGFVPVKDTDRLQRVHTLRAGIATIVDASLVSEVLTEQKRKLDEAKGIQALPFDGDEDDPTE